MGMQKYSLPKFLFNFCNYSVNGHKPFNGQKRMRLCRLLSVLAFCALVAGTAGCAWLAWDPDAGRIVFRDSLANVGPLESKPESKGTQPEQMQVVLIESADSKAIELQSVGLIQPDEHAQANPQDKHEQKPSEQKPNEQKKPLAIAGPTKPDNKAASSAGGIDPLQANEATKTFSQNANDATVPQGRVKIAGTSSAASLKQEKTIKPAAVVPPKLERQVNANDVRTDLASLHGRVIILDEKQQPVNISGAFVRIYRTDSLLPAQPRSKQVHTIKMIDKSYSPRFMTIAAGDPVYFSNLDKIKHNVFSSSGENAFDLGTYGGGLRRQVTLVAPGIVKVYCNIHPQMATFIAIDDGAVATIAEPETGLFTVNDLPAGKYLLKVWHLRGEKEIALTLVAGKTKNIEVELNTESFEAQERKNKFGEKYKNNIAIFDDEFY